MMDRDEGPILDGTYALERRVTWGGMGEIWRGTDLRSGQAVAIKRVPGHADDGSGSLGERLVREARAVAAIAHPNVVRHIAAGFDQEGSPYLVLEWLEGESLEDARRKGTLTLSEKVKIVRQTLKGLEICHRHGIVHRDVKPGNIFLVREGDDLTVKLIDFGLALMADDARRMTATGEIMGTLYYLSPEQAQGLDTGPATDLYSVGVVLYELLAGRPPFVAEKALAVLLKIVTETPPRLRQLDPDLPSWVETVVLRAMARAPKDRYPSAAAMERAIVHGPLGSTLLGQPSAPPLPPRLSQSEPGPLPSQSSFSSSEYRLVSLLCVQPQPGADKAFLQAEARPAVEGDNGILHRLLGGQLIGIYGLGGTAGDEALRAVRAGLKLRSQVGDSASLFVATIHLLFSEGLQLVSDELDDALALLARIPPGEIILDSASRDLTRDRVKLRRRGRREVIDSLMEDRAERPVLGVMTPIVGRASELAYLRSLFDEVKDAGVSHVALVSGAPGLGKSRLGRAILGELRPRSSLCLEARAVASKQRTPYALLGDALARMAKLRLGDEEDDRRQAFEAFVRRHVTPEHQEEVTLFLGEAIGVSFNSGTLRWSEALAQRLSALRVARAEPHVMREKIVSAVERLFLDAAQSGPVTILFEDLQWADDDSLQLLGALIPRLQKASLFFLGTCRPEFFERALPWVRGIRHRVDLAPIDERSMARLLRAILGRIEGEHERRMLDWCDGNPYFAEELVSWMVARKVMVFGKAGWHLVDGDADLELPAGIEGAIQGRLDHLSAEQREILKGASVFGEIFWEDALSILDIPNLGRELEGLAALDFVARAEDSSFAGTRQWFFRHTLLVQVAYRMVPKARRQELHCLAGEWLESAGEEDAAILAQHYARGGDLLRATMHQARVAERALAEGDLDRALASFASSLVPGAGTIPRDQFLNRLLGLATTQLRRGDLMAVQATVDRMEGGGANDVPLLVAELCFLRGRVELIRGGHDEAQVLLLDAIDRFWRLGERHRAFEVKHTLFSAIWVEGRYDDAGPLAEALHREAAPERPEQLCSAKLASAFYNITSGDLSAAIILAEQAADHARDCGHVYREIDALKTLGVAQELCGLFEAALTSFSDARRIAGRLGTTHHKASVEASLGRLRLSQGVAAVALEHHNRAIEAAEGLGDERSLAIALAGRVRALIRLTPQGDGAVSRMGGDREDTASPLLRARTDAERATALAKRRSSPEEIEAKLALLEVLLALGEPAAAAQVGDEAIALLDNLGTHERYEVELLLAASRSQEALGDHAMAMSHLQRAWQALRRRGARITVPTVRESFYRAVPHNRAVQHLWRAKTSSP